MQGQHRGPLEPAVWVFLNRMMLCAFTAVIILLLYLLLCCNKYINYDNNMRVLFQVLEHFYPFAGCGITMFIVVCCHAVIILVILIICHSCFRFLEQFGALWLLCNYYVHLFTYCCAIINIRTVITYYSCFKFLNVMILCALCIIIIIILYVFCYNVRVFLIC